jgi:1-aminocyclopropane-1-carboxylate deaminase/D-cysteine desulfhydrase-like pyridoxal-dependent ACC family enzyme
MNHFSLDLPSPVERIVFRNQPFFLKRDDAIHPDFSGNKARKFHYYLAHDFPDIHTLRSYGSNQSNAMYSLSVLARMRGWRFEYALDHVPSYLVANPHGNYAGALQNGMEIIKRIGAPEEGVLIVEEGGRQIEAWYGIRLLAQEIIAWQETQGIEALDIFLPSGTGTTALYLQKALAGTHRVLTTPCVGDGAYLRAQWAMLASDERYYPTILDLPRKYHFGTLYREFYEIWIELRHDTGVEFDLLYDPKGWLTLLAHRDRLGEHVMYIHQGGLLGNTSMLPRYRRKFPGL